MRFPRRYSPAVWPAGAVRWRWPRPLVPRPAPPQPPRAPDLLLDGLALLITEGHLAGAPILTRALSAFRGDEISEEEGLRWLWVACHAAGLLWDYESWDVLSARLVQLAVDAGALNVLPIALSTRVGVHLFAGELARGRFAGRGGGGGHRGDREQHRALRRRSGWSPSAAAKRRPPS